MSTGTSARPTPDLAPLRERWRTLVDLERTAALLSWDRQTQMPPGGAEARGHSLATLARLHQDRLTAPELREILERVESQGARLGGDDDATVRWVRREVDRATRLPADLVEEIARATNRAQAVWVEARRKADFDLFAPELEKVFDLRRREADALGPSEHPYDVLHDRYEPGSTKERVDAVFGPMRERLTRLLARIRASGRDPGDEVVRGRFDRERQESFARAVVSDFGYDWTRGRLDEAVHPFAQAIGPDDVRITTRWSENDLRVGLFATMHEAGHALYEQGIPAEDARTPLGGTASLAVHESQSRLWENLVGRSEAFWQGRYGALREAFPGAFDDVPLADFVRSIHRVAPTFIRVEADEVTYSLHVVLRYELEVALLEGTLAVRDLPSAWNARMEELLGVVPPDDALGCLQDVHWSLGLIGYFPTYALGSMMSVQLWRAAEADLPSLTDDVRAGRFAPLLGWLREHVHAAGRRLSPEDLVMRATGAPLSAEPYLDHLERKYTDLYELGETR